MRKRSGEQSQRVLVYSVFTQQAVIPTPSKVSTQLDQVGPSTSRSLLSTGKTDIHIKQTSPGKRALQDGTGGQPCQHLRCLDHQGTQSYSQVTSSQKSRSPRHRGTPRAPHLKVQLFTAQPWSRDVTSISKRRLSCQPSVKTSQRLPQNQGPLLRLAQRPLSARPQVACLLFPLFTHCEYFFRCLGGKLRDLISIIFTIIRMKSCVLTLERMCISSLQVIHLFQGIPDISELVQEVFEERSSQPRWNQL